MSNLPSTRSKGRPKAEDKELAEARLVAGRFLKERRLAAGLTQRELATRLGYTTPQFVSNWERGQALPPIPALPELARTLQVPASEIVDVFHAYQEEVARVWLRQIEALVSG